MMEEFKFAYDSLLEEAVSSEPVSGLEFPASWEYTGKFIDFCLGQPILSSEGPFTSRPYDQIPYATEQGINCRVAGN